MSKLLSIVVLMLTVLTTQAQNEKNSEDVPFHSLTLVMAYMLVPNSFTDKTGHIIIVPTFGLNYDYQFNSTWGVGIHTDIILQEYKVEKHDNHKVIVRENPISISGIVFYKPHHQWKIIGGYGVEIEKNENFQLV